MAACGNGNINSSGAAASNENSALQQSDAAENSTRKTSATEENADTEDASTENNADSNTDTEESAQNGTGTENTEGLTFADHPFPGAHGIFPAARHGSMSSCSSISDAEKTACTGGFV